MELLKAILHALVSVQTIAFTCLALGIGLAVAGVYLLAGVAWALLAGAVPVLILAAVLIRGLMHG